MPRVTLGNLLSLDHFSYVIPFFIFRGTIMNAEEETYDNSEGEIHDAGQEKEESDERPSVAADRNTERNLFVDGPNTRNSAEKE